MALQKAQADESSIIIGKETDASGSPISNRADMVQRRYGATEISIDEDSEKVSSEELRAQFAETFGELTGLWATGSFTMNIPEGEGFLPVAQAILGDNSPVSTALEDKTVLPAGTPLTKHVISGESLIGQADKQVLDTMGRFAQAATLRVSLTSAALITSGTAGTVVVRYDVDGTETDLTATFASTALTTPMTLSLPADAKVVKVTTTGFDAGTFDVEAVVVIVSAHDLTDTTVTLANNLSTYSQAFNARVQTNAMTAGSGTITFAYTASGVSGSAVVSVVAGAQTLFAPIPANATINSITVSSGITAGDADIDAVFPLLDSSFFDNNDNIALGVVRAQDLTGTITVADDLAMYTGKHTLTVSPSEDATVSTSGTVTIAYETDGVAHSGVLTFLSASVTTAQTFDLPANSEITGVTVSSGWTDGELDITAPISGLLVYGAEFEHPGRMQFVLSAGKPNGQIKIKGLRKVGIATKDWLHHDEDLDLDATGTTILSTKYFRNIISAQVLDEDGNLDLAGTLTLTSMQVQSDGTSDIYSTVVKVADRMLDNYTLEPEVGGIPRLVERAKFVGATIDNADTLTVACDILAGRVDHERSVESGFDDAFEATAALHPTEFPFPSIGFFAGIGGYLEINGDALIFDSSPITIGHNYDFDTEKSGSLFRIDPERQGRRTVSTSISAKYEVGTSSDDVTLRWQRLYRANAAVDVKIVQYRWGSDGRQKALIWRMPYCEITAPVRVEATSPGSIPITIALSARPDPATTETAEITLEIINDDQA